MLSIKTISQLYKPWSSLGQWLTTVIICSCAMSMGLSMAWPSAALPIIREGLAGFDLSTDEQSAIVAVLFLASFLAPFLSGYVMGRIGKRATLFVSVWLQVGSWLMLALWGGYWVLMAARILSGMWTGVCYAVVLVYIGEVIEPSRRGAAAVLYPLFVYLGSLTQSIFPEFLSYREISWFSFGLNICIAALLCIIPESPYYYLERGDVTSASESLTWLRGRADSSVLAAMQEYVDNILKSPSSYVDLFRGRSSQKALLIVESMGLLQRFSGLTVLVSFTSVTLPDSWVTAKMAAVVLNVVWIFASLASTFVMDRMGRRVLMSISCLGSTAMMLGTGAWFYLRDNTSVDVSHTLWLPLVLLCTQGVFYSIGLVSIPGALQSEMFPPQIKNKATSITSSVLGMGSAISSYIYLPIQESIGAYFNYLICAFASFIALLIAIFVMVETRGKSLEEIQSMLNKQNSPDIIASKETIPNESMSINASIKND